MMHSIFKNIIPNIVMMLYVSSVMLFSYAEGLTLITKIVAVIVFIMFFYMLSKKENNLPIVREWLFLLGWFTVAIISMFFAIDSSLAMIRLFTIVQVYSISFILFCTIVWVRTLTPIWIAIVITVLFVSILTYRNPEAYSQFGRLKGTFNNANLYGLALILGILGCIYLFNLYKNVLVRLSVLSVAFFFMYMLLETGSRKAMAGVFLLIIVLIYSRFKEYISRNILMAVAVLVVGASVLATSFYFLQESTYYHRIERIVNAVESNDASIAGASERGRLELYKKGIEVAMSHPALGVGLDNFRLVTTNSFGASVGTYAHSNLISVLVSTGVTGFVIYYSIYISLAYRLFTIRRRFSLDKFDRMNHTTISLLFMVYVMYDFGMVSYYEKLSWFVMTVILSSQYLLLKKYKNKNVDTSSSEKQSVLKSQVNGKFSSVIFKK